MVPLVLGNPLLLKSHSDTPIVIFDHINTSTVDLAITELAMLCVSN